jgi:carotenoid phi-ring synthase / carotenoid chi-ring synthase
LPDISPSSPGRELGGEKPQVIVVGAGLAGLTAAMHLAERGLRVHLLEADPRYPGGRISAKDVVEIDGWQFPGEHGVHGFWSGYLNIQAMMTRNRIRPMFIPAYEEDWIYRRGNSIKKAAIGSAIRQSWIPAPFHYLNMFFNLSFLASIGPRDLLSLFNIWYALLFAVGIDPLREAQPLQGLSLSHLLKGWSPGMRALFIGLARSGLSGHPDEIPLSGFLAFLRFYTVMRRDSWAFSYLPLDGGSGLIDPIVERIEALGGKIVLGRRVTCIDTRADGWVVHWQSAEDPQITGRIDAPHLILATDSPNTAAILKASPATSQVAADLVFPRGMETAVARLWFDRAPIATSEGGIFSGDFILDNFFWLDQIQAPYLSWRRETGGSAIEVHIYGPPSLLAESDAVLLTRTISDVQAAFPELRGHRIHQIIQRNPPTHTLFGVGDPLTHLGIETPWPNLFCCGDWVRHPNPALFLERACVTGIEAANAVLACLGQQPWPLLDHPRPEPFVGWIEKMMVRGRQARKRKRKGC